MFPGIGALPKPATESHFVNRGTSSPLSAKGPEKKSHQRGKPLQSSFPKYHELFEEPHHCKAADNSLTAKVANTWDSSPSETWILERGLRVGVRVRRHFGARGMSSVRYGTRLGVCVFITAGPIIKLCEGGEGDSEACDMRYDEPRLVWTSLPITH